MREELDAALVEKFPKIFANRYGDLRETAMVWGFSCDDGWYWLLEELCAALQWDTDKNGHPQIVATQVKEKYGTLRFYTQSENDRKWGMISLAESMSARICEVCGATDSVKLRGKAWVKTLCDRCHIEGTKIECRT